MKSRVELFDQLDADLCNVSAAFWRQYNLLTLHRRQEGWWYQGASQTSNDSPARETINSKDA